MSSRRNRFFTDGKLLEDTIRELQADPQKVLPIMKFVAFDGKLWSRSNRRLECYKRAGIPTLIEGTHFFWGAADDHFFGGLNMGHFFNSQANDTERTFCSLCSEECGTRMSYIVHCKAAHYVSVGSRRCAFCAERFPSVAVQLAHACAALAAQLKEGTAFCSVCQKDLPSQRSYKISCDPLQGPRCAARGRHFSIEPLNQLRTGALV